MKSNVTVGVALRTVIMELPADATLSFLIPLALEEAPIHWNKDAARVRFAPINVRLMLCDHIISLRIESPAA